MLNGNRKNVTKRYLGGEYLAGGSPANNSNLGEERECVARTSVGRHNVLFSPNAATDECPSLISKGGIFLKSRVLPSATLGTKTSPGVTQRVDEGKT